MAVFRWENSEISVIPHCDSDSVYVRYVDVGSVTANDVVVT